MTKLAIELRIQHERVATSLDTFTIWARSNPIWNDNQKKTVHNYYKNIYSILGLYGNRVINNCQLWSIITLDSVCDLLCCQKLGSDVHDDPLVMLPLEFVSPVQSILQYDICHLNSRLVCPVSGGEVGVTHSFSGKQQGWVLEKVEIVSHWSVYLHVVYYQDKQA